MSDLDREVVDRLLTTTRAVRRRLDTTRPVEREVCSSASGWRSRRRRRATRSTGAGSWSTTRSRVEVSRSCTAARARGTSSARSRPCPEPDAQTRRVYESAVRLVDVLADVPVHVIPCLEGMPPDATGGGSSAGFYASIFPAVWSFQLALRSRGLGTVLTTLHLRFAEEAAALLGIPDSMTQAALLPVAYYTGSTFRPAERPPVESIVHLNGW